MTPARPLVSCIIPVWNAEHFLDEAIDSVLGQTYDDWELFLIDDGSTDSSAVIIEDAAAHHPARVSVLCHPGRARRGVTATRNLGIRHARGPYVAFLDADDVWLPTKLHDQVELLEAHPSAAMVYGRTALWRNWETSDGERVADQVTDLRIVADRVIEPPQLVPLFLRDEAATCTVNSVMIRKDILDEVGGFEESFPDLYEDFVLWIKVAVRWPVFVSGSVWDRYRHHAGNSYLRAEAEGRFDRTRPNPGTGTYLHWVAFHLSNAGVTDRRIWRVLHRRLRPYRHPVVHAAVTPVLGPARRGLTSLARRVIGPRIWERIRGSRLVTGVPFAAAPTDGVTDVQRRS